jgi:hypothetical protein
MKTAEEILENIKKEIDGKDASGGTRQPADIDPLLSAINRLGDILQDMCTILSKK